MRHKSERQHYRRGAHTVTELKYHFMWKTQYSYQGLRGDIALRLRELIKQVCAEKGMKGVRGNIRAHHIHLFVSAPAHLSPVKRAQYLKGRTSYRLLREFHELRKRYGGQPLGGRGYFWATVGAVTEEQVKQSIEFQEDSPNFQVWDETQSLDTQPLQSDSSEPRG
jgi:putative transposase